MNSKRIKLLEDKVRILESKVDVFCPINDYVSNYKPVNTLVSLIMSSLGLKLKLDR